MSRFGRGASKPPVPEYEAASADCLSLEAAVLQQQELSSSSEPVTNHVQVAAFTVKNYGGRHENEDRMMNVKDVHGQYEFHTIGVLDGHDTDAASDAVSRMLPHMLAKHLKAGRTIDEAYVFAMAEVEDALKKVVATAGTCVCSCTVVGRYVWCANLGDCRAVLVLLGLPASETSQTKVHRLCWLSRDHKAGAPEEMKRIRAAGGVIIDGRIEGLEPSRTLGDFDVKARVRRDVISIVPDVRQYDLGAEDDATQAVLVCATDGVWDVISGQDVCDLILARHELAALQLSMLGGPVSKADTQPLLDIAEDLVRFAVARGSHDDCTAVAALLSI